MFQHQMVITEQCNLRCEYCYMERKNTFMTEDTFQKGMAFLNNEIIPRLNLGTDPGRHTICYFGGEPLLNLDLVRAVAPGYAPRYNQYMPTNGVLLTQDILDELQAIGVSVSLSYDGLGNDVDRLKPGGESSVSDYHKFHLDYMRERGGTKVMISPSTAGLMLDNLKYFVSQGIRFPDYTLVRDDVWDKNSVNTYRKELVRVTDFLIECANADILVIPGLYWLYIMDTITGSKIGKRPFGCFAGVQGAAVMPDGTVWPCARFGSHKVLPYGNCLTGEVNEANLRHMLKVHPPYKYDECQGCPIFQVCNVGCYFEQYRLGGGVRMKPVPQVCDLLKFSYLEAYRFLDVVKDKPQFKEYLKRRSAHSG